VGLANSCAPDWVPGGSSAGSGVAVARGLVSFALGTDTAGSGRPGLVRVGDGAGAAIEAEIWALPPTGFAELVASIPAPLGFGPSTWQVMTSQPASISALAASASRTGIDHSPVKITCTVAFGFTDLAH
jgi:hypothetical protein